MYMLQMKGRMIWNDTLLAEMISSYSSLPYRGLYDYSSKTFTFPVISFGDLLWREYFTFDPSNALLEFKATVYWSPADRDHICFRYYLFPLPQSSM